MDSLERVVEYWFVSELATRTPALVCEQEALDDLMKNYPKPDASPGEWEAYRQFLTSVPEGFQISAAEGVPEIIIAEGNHRVDILYNRMILPGHIDDFQVPVFVQRVMPDQIGNLALQRAMGKQQALHFRFLINLNLQFRYVLEGIGYDVSQYDAEDFTLLRELSQRIYTVGNQERHDARTVSADQTKIFGTMKNLHWLPGDELFSRRGVFSDRLEQYVSKLIEGKECDPLRLLGAAEYLSEGASRVWNEAVTLYLNRESYAQWIGRKESASIKRVNIGHLLQSAVDRALIEQLSSRLKQSIDVPVERGAVTYTSVLGYLDVLKIMAAGAGKADVPLRSLVEILGGRRFGADTKSYSPIHECYERINHEIPEPYRTRIVAHVLDLTGRLHESRNERRSVVKEINDAYSRIPREGIPGFVAYVLGQNLAQLHAGIPLYAAGMIPRDAIRTADAIIAVAGRDDTSLLQQVGMACAAEIQKAEAQITIGESDKSAQIAVDMVVRRIEECHDADHLMGEFHILDARDSGLDEEPSAEHEANDSQGGQWEPPREFTAHHLRRVTQRDLLPGGFNRLTAYVAQPSYLFTGDASLRRFHAPAENEVIFAKTFFLGYNDGRTAVSAGEGLNFIPEHLYLVLPHGQDMAIVYRNSAEPEVLARFSSPIIINTNGLLVVPDTYTDGADCPLLNTYWLVNLGGGSLGRCAEVYLGNAFDPNFNDGQIMECMISSNAALAPVYARAVKNRLEHMNGKGNEF